LSKYLYVVVIIFLISIINLKASDFINLDSLQTIAYSKLNKNINDKELHDIIIRISSYYRLKNPTAGINFINEVLEFEYLILHNDMLGLCYSWLAKFNSALNNNDYAIKLFYISRECYYKILDSENYYWIDIEIGNIYYNLEAYNKAIDIYKAAFEGFNKSQGYKAQNYNYNVGTTVSLNNIGLCYNKLGKYLDAKQNFLRVLDIRKSQNDTSGIQVGYLYLGNTYYLLKKYEESIKNYSNVKEMAVSFNQQRYIGYLASESFVGESYLGLAKVYLDLNKFDSTIYYFNKALPLFKSLDNIEMMVNTYIAFSECYFKKNDLENAIHYAKLAYDSSNSEKYYKLVLKSTKLLSDYYLKNNDIIKSLEYLKLNNAVNDSLNKNLSISTIENAQLSYTVDQKLKEINNLKNQKELNEARLKENNILIFSLAIFSILFLSIVVILFFQSKYKQKINLLLELQNKELMNTNYKLIESERNFETKNNELINTNLMLEESNNSKDKIFSILAHDLKNSVGGVKNMTEVLFDNYDSFLEEEKKDFLEIMKKSSIKLYHLLENLLTWSRSQRGIIVFAPAVNDLYDLIEDCIQLLRQQADNKNIRIHDNVRKNTFAYFDNNMIDAVLRNILSNAIKFTNIEGTVVVSCQKIKNEYLISIRDNGIGMATSVSDGLFDFTRQMSRMGTQGEEGSGLGLVICKDFVEKNGGKIWVESKSGLGSTFYFTVPEPITVKKNPNISIIETSK
jgi:signal transduction histidine kinase